MAAIKRTPTILDHRGRPIKRAELKRPQGNATVHGVRKPFNAPVAPGMTPEALAQYLREASDGDGLNFLRLAEELPGRDLHLEATLSQRYTLVEQLPPAVKPASDDPEHKRHAELVQELVERDDFGPLVGALMEAVFFGFKLVNVEWDSSEGQWMPLRYTERPSTFFQLDRLGQDFRLRDDENRDGVELEPGAWIEHRPGGLRGKNPFMKALARPVSVYHMFKGFSLRDWAVYSEVFGMPIRIGKHQQGASEADIATLEDAVASIGADASAVIPQGMDIMFEGAVSGAGGADVYERLQRYCDQAISKGVLSQTMTTEDGASLSQAQVHERILQAKGRRDAGSISSTLRRFLVRPVVDLNFGPQKAYPDLDLLVEDPEDAEKWHSSAQGWADRGLRFDAKDVRDRLNVSNPDDEGASGEVIEVRTKSADPTPPEPGEDVPPGEDTAQNALNEAAAQVYALMAAGKDITEDQREIIELHRESRMGPDEIDRLVDGAVGGENWRRVAGPMFNHLFSAESYRDFESKLDEIDVTPVYRALLTEAFKARGLGDATDRV